MDGGCRAIGRHEPGPVNRIWCSHRFATARRIASAIVSPVGCTRLRAGRSVLGSGRLHWDAFTCTLRKTMNGLGTSAPAIPAPKATGTGVSRAVEASVDGAPMTGAAPRTVRRGDAARRDPILGRDGESNHRCRRGGRGGGVCHRGQRTHHSHSRTRRLWEPPARIPPWGEDDEPGILVLSHLDTVHSHGTLAGPLPFRLEGDIAHGHGIYDMKGGTLIALAELRPGDPLQPPRAAAAAGATPVRIRQGGPQPDLTGSHRARGPGGPLRARDRLPLGCLIRPLACRSVARRSISPV